MKRQRFPPIEPSEGTGLVELRLLLTKPALEYLEQLRDTGLYGLSVQEVVGRLVDEALVARLSTPLLRRRSR